jgi:hypothetical protein
MKLKKAALIPLIVIVVVAVTLSAVTASVLIAQQKVTAVGTIGGNVVSTINLGVYSDPQVSINCTSIDWGTLNSGDTATKTIYIQNIGNIGETLSMSAMNWNPASASSSLYLTWNQEGATIAPGQIVPATLTLSVASDTGNLSSFNLNIVISGTA